MKNKLKIVIISAILIFIGWSSSFLDFDPLIFNTAMAAATNVISIQGQKKILIKNV